MRDVFRVLGEAEHQVVILRAGMLVRKPADLVEKLRLEDEEMADIHLRIEQVAVIVRLEEGEMVLAVRVDLVLVAVKDVRRLRLYHLVVRGERVRREQVVVVEQGEVVAGRELAAFVGVAGDAFVFLEPAELDARVLAGVFLRDGGDVSVLFVARVGEAELEVRVGLREHGIDHLAQELFVGVVKRDEDAELHVAVDVLGRGRVNAQPLIVAALLRATENALEKRSYAEGDAAAQSVAQLALAARGEGLLRRLSGRGERRLLLFDAFLERGVARAQFVQHRADLFIVRVGVRVEVVDRSGVVDLAQEVRVGAGELRLRFGVETVFVKKLREKRAFRRLAEEVGQRAVKREARVGVLRDPFLIEEA